MTNLQIFKDRTNVIPVSLGLDVSADTLTSELRAGKTKDTTLLGTFTVSFLTDGIDGEILLTIDNSALTAITAKYGWMDVKRVTAGEPVPVFSAPVKVKFEDSVTS